jgi:hypothetical protein
MRAFRYHSIEPEGLWTSDPFPAAEHRHIVQGVIGGFLSGRTRWATDLDGNFIYGLDAKGKEMKAAPSVRAAPPRHHSTKKKSPAQLDREIAETLRRSSSDDESPGYLFVEGVGHRLPRGYEIHWNWIARRDGKKIDGGALTGGDLPEFYETWPDHRGVTTIIAQMKKILREWITSGEFGQNLAPKVSVSLRKSSSEVPIRGR